MMYNDLVEMNNYMTSQEFMSGFGLVQGIPGPLFSFSSFAGEMASSNLGTISQITGAILSGISIFLPGILLIYSKNGI
ncbi:MULTISPECIES: chromate transporter [Helcococcus]|uniref:Chromate transporter n=1 Tax=Helcococcus bovis TaxID=3153252 RepID=A0ABW9F7E2_9FIRM